MAPKQWQDILDSLCTIAKQDGLFKRIENIECEEDLVQSFLDRQYRDSLLSWINSVYKSTSWKKNTTKAKILRENGNTYFRRKNYAKSLRLYSESIKNAEMKSNEIALAFANRAATLSHMFYFEDALRDIEFALINEYPESLRYKLYQRKGYCLFKLEKFKEAVLAYNIAQESLKFACPETKQDDANIKQVSKSIETTLADILRKCVVSDNEVHCSKIEKFTPPVPTFGESEELPCASKALSLRENEKVGRHVIATEDLAVGDILFVEEPFAYVLLPEHYDQRCHHCCTEFRAPVPCWNCSLVLYCCDECRSMSWNKYHRWECYGGLNVVDSVGIAHLGLRIILIAGTVAKHKHFKDHVSCSVDYKDRYSAVYHLVTNLKSMSLEDRVAYSLTAACLVLYLESFTDYFTGNSLATRKSSASLEDIVLIGGLILRHICQLVCNGHAITTVEKSDSSEEFSDMQVQDIHQFRIATAIYPSASMMNHSCDPNIINSFLNTCIVIKAYKTIKKGEEVFNCYGPNYRNTSLQERLEALKAQYHFDCVCSACTEKKDFEEQFSALLCSTCNGPIKEKDIQNNGIKCTCGSSVPLSQLTDVKNATALFDKGCKLLEDGHVKEALEYLMPCSFLQEQCLYRNHKQRSVCLDSIAKCLAVMGDYKNSLSYLQKTRPAVEEQFGTWSVEMAHELQKLSDLMICDLKHGSYNKKLFRIKCDEVQEILQKTKQIFELHYGPWNSSLNITVEKQNRVSELMAAAKL